ncbi:endonuclease/exonuclease/phosphatase family protein [Pelagicoccus sp. SDUM812003]|uniref:endonuclease/exonuclease/phosphatase family protein n=1 Tax=Pelagicoccus sp. SDUM812003 TaxID=3041267 RepID=UPI00280CF8E4|nr:endonuclease/exonuclease/phosphatase family protein [Pelagicoccus sp. SDUM812003]MDQ8204381.1 endonuclease/exonuclease/phosphatase family protein [Pelagicoccus sp. SDUM812003]
MEEKQKSFSLMTFNIAHGRGLSLYQGFNRAKGLFRNLDRIASIIRKHQPDIVALQEIDASSHWNRHINLLDYLQSATDYPYSIHGIHNRREGAKPLAYGNAFLSKHPPLFWKVVPFGSKRLGEKGFLEACFKIENTQIDVINLHLDFRSRRSRLRQIDQLLSSIHQRSLADPYHLPPLICGDFNTSSRSLQDAVHQLINRSADAENYDYVPRSERTFPTHFPSRGLDFILLAQPYHAERTEVLRCFASDHLPVLSTLSFPKDWKSELEGSEENRASLDVSRITR